MDNPYPAVSAVPDGAPFAVEHLRLGRHPGGGGGAFTPAARLVLVPGALRAPRDGLLAAVPGDELRALLFVLSFLTPNGRVRPSLPEVAGAMGVPEPKARERLARLERLVWRGRPLLRCLQAQGEWGLDRYAPSPHLLAERDAPEEEGDAESPTGTPLPPSNREAVLAHSRAAYGRPRALVEAEIAAQLGHAGEEGDSPEAEARRRLRAYGVGAEQVERLLESYPASRILRQARWMGMRPAVRDPARFLVAAIERDFDPPLGARLRGLGERGGSGEGTTPLGAGDTALWERAAEDVEDAAPSPEAGQARPDAFDGVELAVPAALPVDGGGNSREDEGDPSGAETEARAEGASSTPEGGGGGGT